MGSQPFSVLESKILHALEVIHDLRNEKKELIEQIALLEAQIAERDKRLDSLKNASDSEINDVSSFQEREKKIKEKLEKMLGKIASLDTKL